MRLLYFTLYELNQITIFLKVSFRENISLVGLLLTIIFFQETDYSTTL